jgi:hypothetical protein
LRGLLGEAALNDRPQTGGNRGPERLGDFAQDGGADFESGAAFKGQAAGSEFVEDDAESPEIAASVGGVSTKSFGGHVGQGAAHARGGVDAGKRKSGSLEQSAANALGKAEVEDFDEALGSDDDVGTLQIAMDDAAVVSAGERGGNLNAVAEDGLRRQPVSRAHGVQRLAFDEFHHDVEFAVGFADLVNGADVGMR